MNTAMIFAYLICFNDLSVLAIEITELRMRCLRMGLFIYLFIFYLFVIVWLA